MESIQTYFAVAYWRTGRIKSVHRALDRAAQSLGIGTCWGKGPTRAEAKKDALAKADKFRKDLCAR